jgi:hypothetical protein
VITTVSSSQTKLKMIKDPKSFVLGYSLAFLSTIGVLYTYSYLSTFLTSQQHHEEEMVVYEEELPDDDDPAVSEAFLEFFKENWVMKQEGKNKKLDVMLTKLAEPLAMSLGRGFLGNVAISKLREFSCDNDDEESSAHQKKKNLSDSWHIIDEEDEEGMGKEEEMGKEILTSNLRNGVRSLIGFAISQVLGDSQSLLRLMEKMLKNILIRVICANETQRQNALECAKDVFDCFRDKIPISENLLSWIHHAAKSESPGRGFAVSVRGCIIATPDCEIEEVNINQIFIPLSSSGSYRNATTSDLSVVGTKVIVRDSFLIAGSSEESHKEQFEIEAVVMEKPKEISSWLWGSKTTCRVRYVVSNKKPQVVIGADPSSDRARLTILANIPMGPLGKKKARIQLYDTDARAYFVPPKSKDKNPTFEIKLDPVGGTSKDELALVLLVNRFVVRVSSKVRIGLSGATGNWDASYSVKSAEFNRGSFRIPIKLCLDEKRGLRLKVESSIRARFGGTRSPKVKFVGKDSESAMYEVLTNVLSSAIPGLLETVRTQIEHQVRSNVGGREVPLLSWKEIGEYVNNKI